MPHLPALAQNAGRVAMLLALLTARAPGQAVAQPSLTPNEAKLLQALADDPRTSPFVYSTSVRDGRVVLSGRVGSAAYHTAAMQVAIATGISFTDRLIIDTAELARVPRPVVQVAPVMVTPYPYPYPLLGAPIDPLLGFEPPIITYPAWWPAISSRRLAENAAAEPAPAPPPVAPAPAPATMPAPPAPAARPVPPPPPPGNVDPDPPPAQARAPSPPPPPQAGAPSLASTVQAALKAQPSLAERNISVHNHGGEITLSGEVANPSEALSAFQTARHIPDVLNVSDQLRYPVPPPDQPNPLVLAQPAEDLAAFLQSHIQRQLGPGATLRNIHVQDHHLRVGIALDPTRDPAQVAAVVRSMPLLRGFELALDLGNGAVGAK